MPMRFIVRLASRDATARISVCCALALAVVTWPAAGRAAEPAEDFVKQLRLAGYFDTAISYLDRVEAMPGVPHEFIDAIHLEKAKTYVDAVASVRSRQERNRLMRLAEEELQEFLKQSDHPRDSEARLLLGSLQLVRARQLMTIDDPDDDSRQEARQSYLNASETFDEITTDLRGKLEEIQGQRIDAAKQPEKVRLRDQYRRNYLQSLASSAEAKQLAAETYRDPASDGKELLEQALEALDDLAERYSNYLPGALAAFSQAEVQMQLGNEEKAMELFQDAIETYEENAELLPNRLKATAALVELMLRADPPQIKQAIDQAKKQFDGTRSSARRGVEYAALQVALAKAYFAQADALEDDGKPGEARRKRSGDARPLLNNAVRTRGPHESEAREMLAQIGIDRDEDDEDELKPLEIPEVDSLDDALASARELIQANDEMTRMRTLVAQRAEGDGDDAQEAVQELASIDQRLAEGRNGIVQLTRAGLTLGSDDPDALKMARYYLTYGLFQRGDYWDAAAVGQFLSASAAHQEEGLVGGLMALASLQSLLRDASDDPKPGLIRQVESLGKHLATSWPNDPRAAVAKGTMIRLALEENRWDDAKELIGKMPEGAERASFQRLMGQLLWNRSQTLLQEDQQQQADELLPEALKQLQAGLDGIPEELESPDPLNAALVLARVQLRMGDPLQALASLDHDRFGPVKLVDQLGSPTDGFRANLYAVELQAVVGAMTRSDRQEGLLDRATEAMERLQQSIEGKPDAPERLVRTYRSLARNVDQQLEDASGGDKNKLIRAYKVFLDAIVTSSDDQQMRQWVGTTLLQMGESLLQDDDQETRQRGRELLESALLAFEKLSDQLGDEVPDSLRFQQARGYRLAGEYKQAIDLFEKILKQAPTYIQAQIEAAQAYEQWAKQIDPRFAAKAYEAALQGARPGDDGKNTIWGWGLISRTVSGRPEFREMFFDARYHVAFCRFMKGKTEDNQRVIQQAARDIQQVANLYPDLGGKAQRRSFDLLMKEIQRALGQQPVGLELAGAP